MSHDSIDRLSRNLAEPGSRRSLLQLLGAGAAGSVVTAVGLNTAEAKKGGNGKGKKKGNGKGKGNGKDKGNGNGNGQEKVTICHKGQTITVARPAVAAHLKHGDTEGACTTPPVDTCLPVTGTEGQVSEANGVYTATTTGATNYGNLVFDVPEGTTFADIVSLESDFTFTEGGCGVGSPRFVVFLENGNCPYVQFPPELCDTEDQGSTGNLVGNQTEYVWIDDLCGGDASITTYAEALAAYGGEEIDQIVLVTDTSGGETTVTLDPCITLA